MNCEGSGVWMEKLEKDFILKRLVVVEGIAFIGVILLIWLDEVIDIPYLLLGAERTPINWRESLFESLFVLPICLMIIHYTKALFRRLKYLEGFLPICASCKKIRDSKGSWQQMEEYITDRSEAQFSHGICPECAKKLYPEVFGESDRPDGRDKPLSRNKEA